MFEREVVIPARAELITNKEQIAIPDATKCIKTRVLVNGIPKIDKVSAYWVDARFDVNWGKTGGWFTHEGKLIPTGRIIGYWNPRASSVPPTLHTKEELGFGKKKTPVVESRDSSKRRANFTGKVKTNDRTEDSAKAIAATLGVKPADLPDTGPAAVRERTRLTQDEHARRVAAISANYATMRSNPAMATAARDTARGLVKKATATLERNGVKV